MLETEERLFEEYKAVDNICRDSFSSQSGVSQYITEMERYYSYGRSFISSWDNYCRMLKRVKKLRNNIAHETSVTDCNEKDIIWLEDFYRRLLEQQDPLALLRTAKRKQSNCPPRREDAQKNVPQQPIIRNTNLQYEKEPSPKKNGVSVIVWIEVLIIIVAAAAFLGYITNL